MSGGIFFLDEERERESSSVSPPVPSPTISTAGTDSAQNSPAVSAAVPSTSLPPPSLLAPPQINHPGLLAPQPQPLISPLGRKHANSFAATPSFPSPLAQAVTVPLNSDDSSSDSHSEDDDAAVARARRGSPSSGSGTPKRTEDRPGSRASRGPTRSASPASTQKSISRPSSPLRGNAPTTALTPGSLLLNKRSAPGMNIAGSLPNITTMPLRESPPRPGAKEPSQLGPRRSEARAREVSGSGSARGHLRARSGSSSSSMGLSTAVTESSPRGQDSPDLYPEDHPPASHRRRESVGGSPTSSLGGFWGSSWESSSTGSSGTGVFRDKGKAKEGPPPSPRREREFGRTASMSMTSPPRQRRPSEFLNSAFDGRRMPLAGGNRNSAVASLSTSASMVSPLNPLPSPWASGSESSAFSAPSSHFSDASSMTTASSSAGAIRLNRVPTSVKLATELMKNSPLNALSPPLPTANTPSSGTGTSSGTQVTPNPSPVGSLPIPSTVQPGRELGQSASLPVSGLKPSSIESGDSGKLAVPPAPAPSRATSSTDKTPTLGLTGGFPSLLSPPAMPPPSAFKVPPLPLQAAKTRPSAPADVSGGSTLQDPFQTVRHRYRTSMHESYRPILIPEVTASPPSWGGSPTAPTAADSSSATTPDAFKIPERSAAYGLGFNMPASAAAYLTPEGGTGSVTPGGPPPGRSKFRSATGQALQMDLAGVGGMGDAASHATMIMQSRQAKLQRWRPASAGNATLRDGGSAPVPPPFNRSTTSGVPAMLAGPRTDRATAWGLLSKQPMSTASSPGEDLPPIPNTMSAIGVLPEDQEVHELTHELGNLHVTPGNTIGRGMPLSLGGMGMERQASASGTVGGIEWVDWYDCYKRYKDAKIRAEAAEAARSAAASTQTSPKEPAHLSPMTGSSSKGTPATDGGSAKLSPNPEVPGGYDASYDAQSSSAIALTPSTSRDELANAAQGLRKRSASIRSNMSDIRMSPSQKMASIFERPRQSSGSSVRSTDSLGTANLRKKKNLVVKMEGWWNAVKSNFIPESQYTPRLPSNLGASPQLPSAPSSRRGSEMAPVTATSESTGLAPPPNIRRDSGLRPAASHAELRPRFGSGIQAEMTSSSSASANLVGLAPAPRSVSEGMLPPPIPATLIHRAPSTVTEEASIASRSSLESRRRQPSLRLELEPHILTRGSSRTASSGGSNAGARHPAHQPSHATSRSSSYGQPSYGPGLTPGVPKWDQTPSPIIAVNSTADEARENKPVAPGADITIASVRRHVKHRIDAAKIACDAKLKETIDQMAKFAEERKEEEMRLAERESALSEEAMRDYFEGISDSPLVDAEESEVELLDTFSEASRSRNGKCPSAINGRVLMAVSTSRGPSRRASISRPVGSFGASPSRRTSMLPSSPNRLRRRPSAAPRSYVPRDRLSRNFSLSLEKPVSTSSSRSTSRSRSPMPTSRSMLGALDLPSESEKQFLATLQELIVLATDILETSVNYLVAHPSFCAEMVPKIQAVGGQWDEHDDWDGRRWYVQILMAVANLSTILDWWKEEKRFWNFDDEAENEPILFVMRPQRDDRGDAGGDYFRGVAMSGERSPLPGTATLPPSEPLSAVSQGLSSPDSAGGLGPSTARMSFGPTLPLPGTTTAMGSPATPKAQGVEELRVLAEHAKSVNIVMELGLAGEEIQYVNDAIGEVTGRDPDEVLFKPISDILAPADASTFTDATQKLLEDDNNTVQLRVRFEVQAQSHQDDRDRAPGPVYIELEGVGMLMREQDQPSHTMWVLKPVPAIVDHTIMDVTIPLEGGNFSNEGILCRICEREIVTWFFEKHNETCDAVHRLEAEISECNDCLQDLYHTVVKLNTEIEDSIAPAQYQGVMFFTLPESVTSAEHSPPGPQGVELRKMTRGHLAEIIDILAIAKSIETPSVRDDEADLPFNVQCYLDMESEDNLATITRWQRPLTTDRALTLLFTHVEMQLRRKQKAIARMQSTIRYSEKTRHEWEDKVNQVLAEREGDEHSESGSGGADGEGGSDSGGELSPVANTTVETIQLTRETSPPTSHRKIAPKARLPITVGHPRPATAPHESESATPAFGHGSMRLGTMPPTPIGGLSVPPTPAPPSASIVQLPLPPQGISPTTIPTDLNSPSPTALASQHVDAGLPLPPSMSAPALAPLAPPGTSPSPFAIAPPPPAPPPMAIAPAAIDSTPLQIPDRPKPDLTLSPLLVPEKFGHLRRKSLMPGGKDLGPLSPRIPSAALPSRVAPPSIKDFEIIKPISRGAFGSVYLAKKVATGDYYAIKALKKSDMIAKNQITNVKAERTILMNQASSPYVVKLFFSFQSKDYLYLVMEYLNGGDCATLVKTLGGLPEEWARNYIAEVVLGLEYLHARNIVHRDIKPDNLLIDSRGHLKLTDFGLSRIGLLNRQVGGPRPAYLRGTSLRGSTRTHRPPNPRTSSASSNESNTLLSPELQPPLPISTNLSQSYFGAGATGSYENGSADESSGSESADIIPKMLRNLSTATKLSSDPNTPSVSGKEPPRFVGTPDYLAPESILGIGTDDTVVDWWALGVVLYEFIYGIPPFHADTPEKVFDNVISRRIQWHEDEMDVSPEAHDLMDRLMCSNAASRLGAQGAEEVKAHPFFSGVDWATITTAQASFVPEVTDPESTDYFDSRGAVHAFHDEEAVPQVLKAAVPTPGSINSAKQQRMEDVIADISAQTQDDFGTFNFKNLPVLKQANDDVIRKMRTESMPAQPPLLDGALAMKDRPRSLSVKVRHKPKRKTSDLSPHNGPPSPATSTSSAASTPSRGSVPPSTPGTGPIPPIPMMPQHFRRPSELNALDRVKSSDDGEHFRRVSAPTHHRMRAGSGSSGGGSERSASMELWRQRRQASMNVPEGMGSALGLQSGPMSMTTSLPMAIPLDSPDEGISGRVAAHNAANDDRALDVLIAEDNPISQKILETLLTRMGCRCICVEDGPQALAATMGHIRFDVIIVDIHMPVVNGEQVARMIRSTNNHNQNTPIIAATSYEQGQALTEEGTLFSAILAKPVSKTALMTCLAKLGFVLSAGTAAAPGSTASAGSAGGSFVGSIPNEALYTRSPEYAEGG